jgi:hypothetical protein
MFKAFQIVEQLLENAGDIDPKAFLKRPPLPSSIQIEGRLWWRRGYGGMYNVAHIWVDGNYVGRTAETGGGGDNYLYNACDWLEDHLYIPKRPTGTPVWKWIRDDLKIDYIYGSQDVKRRKDLF